MAHTFHCRTPEGPKNRSAEKAAWRSKNGKDFVNIHRYFKMAAEARKAVIKNGDMADILQQDAVDSALAVSPFEHARNPGLFQAPTIHICSDIAASLECYNISAEPCSLKVKMMTINQTHSCRPP